MTQIIRVQRLAFLILALLVGLTATPVAADQALPEASAPQWADAVHLLSSTDDETIFQVRSEGYRLEDVAGVDGPCQRLTVDGFATGGAAGSPGLPMRSVLLGIPAGATPSLEILSQPVHLAESHTICPAPAAVAEEGDGQVVRSVEQDTAADSTIYGQNSLYPATAARMIDDGWVGRLRFVRVEVAPFQYNPSNGSLIHYPELQVRVQHRGGRTQAASIGEEDDFAQSMQGMLLNGARAGQWAIASRQSVAAATNPGWMPPSPALRLSVKEEGLYAVTYEELADAGVPVSSILSHSLRLYLDGQDVAVRVVDGNNVDDVDGLFDPGDRLLFYGQGVNEKYTDANVYWLTYGATGGLHMITQSQGVGGDVIDSYQATARYEENFNYVSSAPKRSGFNHWYGRLLTVAGSNTTNSWRVPIAVSALVSRQA